MSDHLSRLFPPNPATLWTLTGRGSGAERGRSKIHSATEARSGLEVRRVTSAAELRIELRGALEANSCSLLVTALDADADRMVLDLSGLESIDRPGVFVILAAHLSALDDHRRLLIVRGNPEVQAVVDGVEAPLTYVDPAPRISPAARMRPAAGGAGPTTGHLGAAGTKLTTDYGHGDNPGFAARAARWCWPSRPPV